MDAGSVPTLIVFGVAWLLVASRRLRWLPIGRPAGALAGAVGMVAVGALDPEAAWRAIDGGTITLLLGMMLVTAYVERAGLFERIVDAVLRARPTPAGLLGWLVVGAAALSALLVNDTVCLFLTPMVVALVRRARLPAGPYLLALATSANLGSAATTVGNPQNMLIGSMSGIGFARWLVVLLPATLAALAVHAAFLRWRFAAELGSERIAAPDGPPAPWTPEATRTSLVCAGILLGFLAGGDLGTVALGGAVALFVLDRTEPREALRKVDLPLLLFFSGLFVVVAGFATTGLPDRAWAALAPYVSLGTAPGLATLTAALTVGSNLVSNVPLVLLVGGGLAELGEPGLSWPLLGFVTTVAGNLTLVGSVANIIVAEQAKPHHELGFGEYLRVGLPSTILSLAVGVPVLAWTARHV